MRNDLANLYFPCAACMKAAAYAAQYVLQPGSSDQLP